VPVGVLAFVLGFTLPARVVSRGLVFVGGGVVAAAIRRVF
jgi:hypothetical protein